MKIGEVLIIERGWRPGNWSITINRFVGMCASPAFLPLFLDQNFQSSIRGEMHLFCAHFRRPRTASPGREGRGADPG